MLWTYAAGVFAIMIWAFMPVLAKLALAKVTISYFLLIRFGVAAVVSLLIWPSSFRALRRLRWPDGTRLGLTLTTNFALSSYALTRMPATWFVVTFSLSPIISLYALGLKTSRRAAFGVALAALGTFGFVVSPTDPVPVYPTAFAALFVAMLLWTYYSRQLKELQRSFGDGELTALTNLIVLPPVVAYWALDGAPHAGLHGTAAYALLIMGILVPFAYWAFSLAIRRAPIFGITCQYLEPVVGVVLASILLGESINGVQLLGSTLILGGIALTTPAADA